MVRITPELVRRRAEHNDMELSTLEELSLHQMNIEKIEHLHRWCPRLKILLLQGNLIPQIENVSRLKELEYLNLALNNIERISGLERCEALTKLDLTANFIIYLTSLSSLQGLSNLKDLYLTGNPCTEYRGYRTWIVNHLPYLQELDGKEILHSEHIKCLQKFYESVRTVEEDQVRAVETRERQKERYAKTNIKEDPEYIAGESSSEDEEDIRRWCDEITENTPEVRVQMHREIQRRRERSETTQVDSRHSKKEVRYFTSDGRPLNLNKANLEFVFKEDEEENAFILEVRTYRYLDSSCLTCDIQPTYVRVMLKQQPLQLVFPSEVKADQATAQRSQVTGHLVIVAPKVDENDILKFSSEEGRKGTKKKMNDAKEKKDENEDRKSSTYLELDSTIEEKLSFVDTSKKQDQSNNRHYSSKEGFPLLTRPDSPNFQDDPEVPPLI